MPHNPPADLMLILEGTYPYVRGGVSSWVANIIKGLPEISFSLVFIGSRQQDYGKKSYDIPDNIVHYEEHFLYDSPPPPAVPPKISPKQFQCVEKFHSELRELLDHKTAPVPDLSRTVKDNPEVFNESTFLHSKASWNFISECFHKYSTEPSFIDYFWTVRNLHQPLWVLLKLVRTLPPAAAYHSVSTGYAGFLGAMLQHSRNAPYILMEHGIYTKERRIDLLAADWIADNRNPFQHNPMQLSYLREMWIRFFEALGKFAYDSANPIISLYNEARQRQIDDGADPYRTMIIPNGVNIERLAPLREQRPFPPPPVLCLLGRVVPIKDIKTFIRAMRTVANRLPEAEGWIVGPTDEDPDYFEECQQLVTSLGLKDKVKFLGFQKITDILPQSGVLVLSSISEGLPLVILEAYASGLPCISTDVGSCRELIEGRTPEDQAIGPSGKVVGIADPAALAGAALELLTNPEKWRRAQQAAITRVETYYTEHQMLSRFREIYTEAIEHGRYRLRTTETS